MRWDGMGFEGERYEDAVKKAGPKQNALPLPRLKYRCAGKQEAASASAGYASNSMAQATMNDLNMHQQIFEVAKHLDSWVAGENSQLGNKRNSSYLPLTISLPVHIRDIYICIYV